MHSAKLKSCPFSSTANRKPNALGRVVHAVMQLQRVSEHWGRRHCVYICPSLLTRRDAMAKVCHLFCCASLGWHPSTWRHNLHPRTCRFWRNLGWDWCQHCIRSTPLVCYRQSLFTSPDRLRYPYPTREFERCDIPSLLYFLLPPRGKRRLMLANLNQRSVTVMVSKSDAAYLHYNMSPNPNDIHCHRGVSGNRLGNHRVEWYRREAPGIL